MKPLLLHKRKFKQKLIKRITPYEKKLDDLLGTYKIKHNIQYIISPYIVDFFIPSKGLVIELDGYVHDTKRAQIRDARRDSFLFSFYLMVLRYKNQINAEKIIEEIANFEDLKTSKKCKIYSRIAHNNNLFSTSGYDEKSLRIINPSHRMEVVEEHKKQLRKKYFGDQRNSYDKYKSMYKKKLNRIAKYGED